MAATAQYIEFDSHIAKNYADAPGVQGSALTVNFRIYSQGPAHVAGLIYTTDFWITTVTLPARFLAFQGPFEVWQTVARVPNTIGAVFEYTIFCDDHRDVNNVKKIYHTNYGNGFHIGSTW